MKIYYTPNVYIAALEFPKWQMTTKHKEQVSRLHSLIKLNAVDDWFLMNILCLRYQYQFDFFMNEQWQKYLSAGGKEDELEEFIAHTKDVVKGKLKSSNEEECLNNWFEKIRHSYGKTDKI